MSVGILVVSHSGKIADGVVELAAQMAPDVRLVAAGGTADGGIGTDFEAITDGIAGLRDTDGVVVLCDLGSAYLTTDTALDFLEDSDRERVRVSRAPLVEGAVAAAVAAQTGGSVDDVLAAADTASRAGGTDPDRPAEPDTTRGADDGREARHGGVDHDPGPAAAVPDVDEEAGAPVLSVTDGATGTAGPGAVSATVELVNESGLHARPAAAFVRTAARFHAAVTVDGVDAKSLLAIMALALPQGAEIEIDATGTDAQDAVEALVTLVESGFGE